MSIFETFMLICFGSAWPASIWKSYKSRSTRGKSILFLWIVEAGYMSGVLHKIVYSPDSIIIFYILNFTMVAFDIGLYYRNRMYENDAIKPPEN